MTGTLRILSAEAVIPGVLKIVWDDGYQGVVDVRGLIGDGELFEPLRTPDTFRAVKVQPHGHAIYWGDADDEDVDFGCDRLREMAEEQAALLARAS